MSHPARLLKQLMCSALGAAALLGPAGCERTVAPPPEHGRYNPIGEYKGPAYLRGTVKSLAVTGNTGIFPVTSYGLVGGLHRTGDSTCATIVREWMVKEMYRHGLGSATLGTQSMRPEQMLSDPRFAIVQVVGYIAPGARKGDPMDVTVQALPYPNTTSSLADGVLYRTALRINGTGDPFGAINEYGKAQGNIFVNPAYALSSSSTQPSARQSLRTGSIPGGGIVTTDRPIIMQVRMPSWAGTRSLQERINQYYQVNDSDFNNRVASAVDDGLVNLYVPNGFRGNWEHFLGLTKHLFMNGSAEFAAVKARELAVAAVQPDAFLDDISYAWEGLGPAALPFITPLMTHPTQAVQFAASRAAAFLGDRYGEDMLLQIARTSGHEFQVRAVQELAQLRDSAIINAGVAELLDSDNALVRIEAYNLLIKQNDPRILSKVVHPPGNGENAFFLDMVPSTGAPLVYCTRVGQPRIAVFGRGVTLSTPMTFSAFDTRLVITTMDDVSRPRQVKIVYRDPQTNTPVQAAGTLDVAELIGRLGGLSGEGLHFTYGDIVAILQSLSDPKKQKLAAAFKLQDPRVEFNPADPSVPPTGGPEGRPQQAESTDFPAGKPESLPKMSNATAVTTEGGRPQ